MSEDTIDKYWEFKSPINMKVGESYELIIDPLTSEPLVLINHKKGEVYKLHTVQNDYSHG